jgi:SPP1 family predicted phage head-tail adaptor
MSEVAGRLTERVVIMTPVTVDDGEGGKSTTWTSIASVPAAVESLNRQERLQAAASETTVTHRVLIRWIDGVTATARLYWGTRVLEVVGPPAEIGRRKLLECDCAERVL